MQWKWKNRLNTNSNIAKFGYKLHILFYCIWTCILHDTIFALFLIIYNGIFLCLYEMYLFLVRPQTVNKKLLKMKNDQQLLVYQTSKFFGCRVYSNLRILYFMKNNLNPTHLPLYSKEYYYHLFSSNNIPHPPTIILQRQTCTCDNINSNGIGININMNRDLELESCVKLIEASDSVFVKPSESYLGQYK